MPRIRNFAPGDEQALAAICLRTAAGGGDAAGLLQDDDIWASMFVLPFLECAPQLAFVVESDDGRAVGYILGAADSEAFEAWFGAVWWPRFAQRWPKPESELSQQDGLLVYAYSRTSGLNPYAARYPAHLHMDLLPELQGQGWGRRLVETLKQALRDAGVAGLHVVPLAENTGARAFYERIGFTEIGSEPGVVFYGLDL
jgi:ribosomal protein S18 acetylase RimI-like enzyme